MLKVNVLVVEDCSVMRYMIKRTLALCKIQLGSVLEASNGREGLELLKNNKVDLLILDMNMPVMDGMEMLQTIHAKNGIYNSPVLIVSTESNSKRVKSIASLGSGYVHKPFSPEALKEEILRVINEEKVMGRA